ncbi:MAG: sulfite exporter TauE/SafE family protein [Phycisphaerae bacterium]|jgi:hypothetical protein
MKSYLIFAVLGLSAGALSGLVGLGGGVFLIPALVFFAGMSQHQAVGTALAAMVPPVTLGAAAIYYREGHVNLRIALLISAMLAVGSWGTSHLANRISDLWLQRLFGVMLLFVAFKLLWKR